MKDDNSALGLVGLTILAAIAAGAAYSGMFWQTGTQWFNACWTAQNSERPAKSPDESIAWSKCPEATQRALFDAGFVFAGNPQYAVTPQLRALVQACPSNYTDIPLMGSHILAVSLIEKTGGPQFQDKFIPPDSMIVRAFKSRWPLCPTVRASNGFPRIVKQGSDWVFEEPCKPCEAEAKAIKGDR